MPEKIEDQEKPRIGGDEAQPLTPAQIEEVMKAADRLDSFCVGWPIYQIVSALFIVTATSAVNNTTSTDDEIIGEFRKCLLDARTRGATRQ